MLTHALLDIEMQSGGGMDIEREDQSGIQELVQALRRELIEYGQLLVLLEEQQNLILDEEAAGLLDNVGGISSQIQVIGEARGARELLGRGLAEQHGQPADIPFRRLISMLPRAYSLLLGALVDEINDLLTRSQQRLLQNNLLIRASMKSGLPRFESRLRPANLVMTNGTEQAGGWKRFEP